MLSFQGETLTGTVHPELSDQSAADDLQVVSLLLGGFVVPATLAP